MWGESDAYDAQYFWLFFLCVIGYMRDVSERLSFTHLKCTILTLITCFRSMLICN